MSDETKDTETKPDPAKVMKFKLKVEAGDELTLDETMDKLAEVYRLFAPLKEQLENLKEVAKAGLKAKGETSYTNTDGVKVCFRSKQAAKINKALAKEICGARWAEVESFKTETSFHVIVPGVKSPDAE